jgi:hypothetical protein
MEDMSAVAATIFDRNYELHQKHLKLKGLQPKTIDAYSRAIRRVGDYFDHQIDDLSEVDCWITSPTCARRTPGVRSSICTGSSFTTSTC